MGDAVVISPHLDDAVFACGVWLAMNPGTIVVTVFAGVPEDGAQLTDWDARCGFSSAAQAVQSRREEDKRALARLEGLPRWLAFSDSQYARTPLIGDVAQVLRQVLQELSPRRILFPLGLFHSDHRLVHEACVLALRATGEIRALAYEDGLYRGMKGVLQERLAELQSAGVCATPASQTLSAGPMGERVKAAAVLAYASQLRAFGPGGYDDTTRPERFWELDFGGHAPARPAHGTENGP